jgi:hypothetical protein
MATADSELPTRERKGHAVSARRDRNLRRCPPPSVIFLVTPWVILPGQWQTGAWVDPDLRSGAMCFVLAIAAYTLKVGMIVLATAFGYRGAMMHFGGHRDETIGQATFATWFRDQLLGPQLAPPPIAALAPAVTPWSIQGGRLPGQYQCTFASRPSR